MLVTSTRNNRQVYHGSPRSVAHGGAGGSHSNTEKITGSTPPPQQLLSRPHRSAAADGGDGSDAGGGTCNMEVGLSVSLRSTLSGPFALHCQMPIVDGQTAYVLQCVRDARTTLLLARDFVEACACSTSAADAPERTITQVLARLVRWDEEQQDQQRQRQLKKKRSDSEEEEQQPPHHNTTAAVPVAEQMLSLIAQQEEDFRNSNSNQHRGVGANTEDNKESGSSDGLSAVWLRDHYGRHVPNLRDLCLLAQHLLVPLDVLRQQHLWLFITEDVPYSLHDRLFHSRVVRRSAMPLHYVSQLWEQLWAVLGAAWRQRARLWGVYGCMEGPNALRPFVLSCEDESCSLPPGVNSPPIRREHYHYYQRNRQPSSSSGGGEGVGEADSCAFGPMTARSIGITPSRRYAIRDFLASRIRTLQCQTTATAQNSKSSHSPHSTFSPRSGSAGRGERGAAVAEEAAAVFPFFDASEDEDDVSGSALVPYLSPECYMHFAKERYLAAGEEASQQRVVRAMAHCFSDDAWNVAVLVVEAALTGFNVQDPNSCHLGQHSMPNSHCNASSVYADILSQLTSSSLHGISVEAAQNFLYAALFALGAAIDEHCRDAAASSEAEDVVVADFSPCPKRLAKEWLKYLLTTYGSEAVKDVFCEVATNGLLPGRSARWEVFQRCHDPQVMRAAAAVEKMSEDASLTLSSSLSLRSQEEAISSLSTRSKAQSVLDSLMTPLLPLIPNNGSIHSSSDGSSNNSIGSTDVWRAVQQWRRQVEQRVALEGGAGHALPDVRRGTAFTEFVRLARQGIGMQLLNKRVSTSGDAAGSGKSSKEPQQYTVACHPFIRGLMERSLLPAYALGSRAPPVSTPRLFLRYDTLTHVLREHQEALQLTTSRYSSPDTPSPSSPTGRGMLHMMMGGLDAKTSSSTAQQQQQHPARSLDVSASSPTTQPQTARAQVDSMLGTHELSVAEQLCMITAMRALLLRPGTPQELGAAVREHLIAQHQQQQQQDMMTGLVPIPPTLRGEVWGALMEVPRSRERESLYGSLNTRLLTAADRQIAVDIPRCHQYLPLLASPEGHEKLTRLVKAWMLLSPSLTYWQGADSVCAMLLSVSFEDEALVAVQLNAMIEKFVALDDESAPHGAALALSPSSPSSSPKLMSEQLHQLTAVLRYCDPLLATYLDQMECRPQLYAISWLLTAFAHHLPARKVYLLWDFLLLYHHHYPHVLLCMCCAILTQRRTGLLGADASGCLAMLGSGTWHTTDIAAVVRDTACLMRAIPASVGVGQPELLRHGGISELLREVPVAWMAPHTLLNVLKPSATVASSNSNSNNSAESAWAASGVFLIDVRPQDNKGAVLGAIRFPLPRGTDDDDSIRCVEQTASELLRIRSNYSMAALPPSSGEAAAADGQLSASPLALKTAQSPHLVLLTAGGASQEADAATASLRPALALVQELVHCGAHNVSVLLGGVEGLVAAAPWLDVAYRHK